jgi:hypothetical protein
LRRFLVVLPALVFLAGCATPQSTPTGGQRGAFVDSAALGERAVILIPQWHLGPNTNTTLMNQSSENSVPQAENQNAIFDELSDWIDRSWVKKIVLEGCEGASLESNRPSFNGWNLAALKAGRAYERSITHVGLRLLAKYETRAPIDCGDDLELIKKNQLALSDVRGLLGFKLRVEQVDLKPEDRTRYMATIKKLLKLQPGVSEKEVSNALDKDLRRAVQEFERLIALRNDKMIAALLKGDGRRAVVVGAIHVKDLKAKLVAEKLDVVVWRPKGLNPEDEDFMSTVKSKIF